MSRSLILPKRDELYTHDWNQRAGNDDGTHDACSSMETNCLEQGREIEWSNLFTHG